MVTKVRLRSFFFVIKNIDLVVCSPNYFKRCKISALALLKLVMHARSGGTLEVMGMLLGKIDGENMIVMDAFALPVEGTGKRTKIKYDEVYRSVNYRYELFGFIRGR
jgi:hypothetical protein